MPIMQAIFHRLNERYHPSRIRDINRDDFAPGAITPGTTAAAIGQRAGTLTSSAEIAFTQSMPPGIQEMLRALIYFNLGRPQPLGVTWAWRPGYDWDVQVWECPGTEVSPGGITILLTSRYPLDPHPSTLTSS